MGRDSTKSLAPGFRFHPTDEELVRYYLKRKVSGKSFRFDAITQFDVYKSEPWELPDKSKMHSRDLEWYFFSALDKKYGNGSRTNRATDQGYWKTTGKDRPVYHNSRVVGMKKTLVFHEGRAPRGARSNWVMHEYRLVDEELEKAGVMQDAFVLCRIFQKSGTGPKNGEQYGAPFIEEEWDDDELIMVPGEQVAEQVEPKAEVCDGSYVGDDDVEQNLDLSIAPEEEPILVDMDDVDQSNYCAYSGDLFVDDNKPFIGGVEYLNDLELPDDQKHVDSLENNFVDSRLESNDYHVDGTNGVSFPELDFLLDEPYLDATSGPLFGDGLFLNEMEALNPDLDEEYLSFFNGEDNNTAFDSPYVIVSEEPFLNQEVTNAPTAFTENERINPLATIDEHCLDPSGNDGSYSEVIASEELLLNHELTNVPTAFTEYEGTELLATTNKHCLDPSRNDGSSSSSQNYYKDQNSDCKSPFEKYSASMLASIPAPDAFASEFLSKDVITRLTSAAPASVTHVTAGMIQIANMNAVEWSYPKPGIVDLTFTFTLPQHGHISSLLSGKTTIPSILSRGWIYLIFFWVLVLSTSYKIGTCLYAH